MWGNLEECTSKSNWNERETTGLGICNQNTGKWQYNAKHIKVTEDTWVEFVCVGAYVYLYILWYKHAYAEISTYNICI